MTKILIIDDSPLIRVKIKQMLSLYDLSKIETDIEAGFAIEYIRQNRPDMVILDIELKERNGLLLIKQIKELNPKIKVIVFTNLAMPAYKNLGRKLNADYFFDKTTEIPEFLSLFQTAENIADSGIDAASATSDY